MYVYVCMYVLCYIKIVSTYCNVTVDNNCSLSVTTVYMSFLCAQISH